MLNNKKKLLIPILILFFSNNIDSAAEQPAKKQKGGIWNYFKSLVLKPQPEIVKPETRFEDLPKALQNIIFEYSKEWNVPEKVKDIQNTAYSSILAASPDNNYLAVSNGFHVAIFDTQTWQNLTPDLGFEGLVDVKFSPNSQLIAITIYKSALNPELEDFFGSVEVFEIKNKKPIAVVNGGKILVPRSLSFSADNKKIAVGFDKNPLNPDEENKIGALKIVNLKNGEEEVSKQLENPQVAFLPDNNILYSFEDLFDYPDGTKKTTFVGLLNNPKHIAIPSKRVKMTVSPTGKYFALHIVTPAKISWNHQINVFKTEDLSNPEAIESRPIIIKSQTNPNNFFGVENLQFLTDKYIVGIVNERSCDERFGCAKDLIGSSIYIWDVNQPQKKPTIITREDLSFESSKNNILRTFAISPDGKFIAVSDVQNLKIFNFQDLLKGKHA